MRKYAAALAVSLLLSSTACSPRDFLTRRLAIDLIAGADTFKAQQLFWIRTGIVSNKDYTSPEYLVLQHHGWMTGTNAPCIANVGPPPCWDMALTPLGVDALKDWVSPNGAQYFSVPVARRELIAVTGIAKNGNLASVDFLWKWAALNEVGDALYAGTGTYSSTVTFVHYDDGWRVMESGPARSNQRLDEALKNAEPVQ
ncbi:MAG TPA: hypothetical protein VLW84_08700 [Terriglobales bacterium]|nr:hypothetical protein [Terriglobales bacterium]